MTRPTIVIQISPKQLWTAVVVLLASVMSMVGVNIAYTNYVDGSSNRVWCPVLAGLTAQPLPANATDSQKSFYQKLVDLERKLDC